MPGRFVNIVIHELFQPPEKPDQTNSQRLIILDHVSHGPAIPVPGEPVAQIIKMHHRERLILPQERFQRVNHLDEISVMDNRRSHIVVSAIASKAATLNWYKVQLPVPENSSWTSLQIPQPDSESGRL